jgi:hypothetical protein
LSPGQRFPARNTLPLGFCNLPLVLLNVPLYLLTVRTWSGLFDGFGQGTPFGVVKGIANWSQI